MSEFVTENSFNRLLGVERKFINRMLTLKYHDIPELNQNLFFDFETLIPYQKALDYVDFVYDLSSKFPKKEMYGLFSRFRRVLTR